MANVKTLAAALGLAGAMLAPTQASFAQDFVRQVPVAPLYVDCYYDLDMSCRYGGGAYGAYAAIGPIGIGAGPYAAIVAPGYGMAAPRFWGPLRDGDWTAVHGAAGGASR